MDTDLWNGTRAQKTFSGVHSPLYCHVSSCASSGRRLSYVTSPTCYNNLFLQWRFTVAYIQFSLNIWNRSDFCSSCIKKLLIRLTADIRCGKHKGSKKIGLSKNTGIKNTIQFTENWVFVSIIGEWTKKNIINVVENQIKKEPLNVCEQVSADIGKAQKHAAYTVLAQSVMLDRHWSDRLVCTERNFGNVGERHASALPRDPDTAGNTRENQRKKATKLRRTPRVTLTYV
jgi:hypothetical protein